MRISICLFFLLAFFYSLSQPIVWNTEHQSIDVPHIPFGNEEITEVFVDSEGLIWIISFNAIITYNGQSFSKINTEGIEHGSFLRMKEFENGMKVVIDFNGSFFFVDQKKITPYKNNYLIRDLNPYNSYHDFCFVQDSILMVSYQNGKGLLEIGKNDSIISLFDRHQIKKRGTFIIFIEDTKLPIVTGGNLRKPDWMKQKLDDTLYILNHEFKVIDSITLGIKSFYHQKDLVALNDGSFIFSNGEKSLIHFNQDGFINKTLYPSPILRLIVDDSNLFISTLGNGVHWYKNSNIKVESRVNLFENEDIALTAVDKQGGFWFFGRGIGVKYQNNPYLLSSNLKPKSIIRTCKDCQAIAEGNQLTVLNNKGQSSIYNHQHFSKGIFDLRFNPNSGTLYIGVKEQLFKVEKKKLFKYSNNRFKDTAGFNFYFADYIDHKHIQMAGHIGMEAFLIDQKDQIKVFDRQKNRIKSSVFCEDFYATKSVRNDINIAWSNGKYDSSLIKDRLYGFNSFLNLSGQYIISREYDGISILKNNKAFDLKYKDSPIYNAYLVKTTPNQFWAFNNDASFKIKYLPIEDRFDIQLYEPLYIFPINRIWTNKNTLYCRRANGVISKIEFQNIKPYANESEIKVNRLDYNGASHYTNLENIELNSFQRQLKIYWKNYNYKNRNISLRYSIDGVGGEWNYIEGDMINLESMPYGKSQFVLQEKLPFSKWETIHQLNINTNYPFWMTYWFYSIVILISLIGSISIYKRQIKKNIKENLDYISKIDNELKVLRSQMNPHFLSNLISSIKFLVIDGQNKKANLALGLLAKISRKTFNFSTKQFVSIEEEIQFIKEYIMLQEIRIDSSINFEYDLFDIGNPEQFYIYPFLIQPLIENSVIHGIKSNKGEKRITLIISNKGDHIEIEVIDNGAGGASKINSKSATRSKSSSTYLILEKIEMMAKNSRSNFYGEEVYDNKGNVIGSKVFLRVKI